MPVTSLCVTLKSASVKVGGAGVGSDMSESFDSTDSSCASSPLSSGSGACNSNNHNAAVVSCAGLASGRPVSSSSIATITPTFATSVSTNAVPGTLKPHTTTLLEAASVADVTALGDTSPRNDDVCRDYLRNVCKRGPRCKYRHPNGNEAHVLGQLQEYTFCHDYQNSGCRRPNCKFIHCSREEEEYYKSTGQLPVRLQQAAALGIGIIPKSLPILRGDVPICKDYLKGECKRGGRCKFRHLTLGQYDVEVKRSEQPFVASAAPVHGQVPAAPPHLTPTPCAPAAAVVVDNGFTFDAYEMAIKRRRLEVIPPVAAPQPPIASFGGAFGGAVATPFPAPALPTVAMTNDFLAAAVANTGAAQQLAGGELSFEDNFLLKRKIEELKKQMTSLIATNEVLLEQNARYRHHAVGAPKLCNVAITNAPPIVTVSQVVTPTITPAPADVRHQQVTTPLMTPIAATPLNAMPLLFAAHEASAPDLMALSQTPVPAQQMNSAVAASQTAVGAANAPAQAPTQPAVTLAQPTALKMAPQGASTVLSVPVSQVAAVASAQPSAMDLRHQQVAVAATRNAAAAAAAANVVNALAQTSLTHVVPTATAVAISAPHQTAPAALVSYPVASHAVPAHPARALPHLPTSSLAVGCIQPSA